MELLRCYLRTIEAVQILKYFFFQTFEIRMSYFFVAKVTNIQMELQNKKYTKSMYIDPRSLDHNADHHVYC